MHAERQTLPDGQHVDLTVEGFGMRADHIRVPHLWLLVEGEASVNELATALGKPAVAVSQHLSGLRLAGLVPTRRLGTSVFDRIGNDHVAQVAVDAIHDAEHAGPDVPAHHCGADVAALPKRASRD